VAPPIVEAVPVFVGRAISVPKILSLI